MRRESLLGPKKKSTVSKQGLKLHGRFLPVFTREFRLGQDAATERANLHREGTVESNGRLTIAGQEGVVVKDRGKGLFRLPQLLAHTRQRRSAVVEIEAQLQLGRFGH
jgi:hypothetical protein